MQGWESGILRGKGFLGSKVSKIYHISISCFPEGIGPASKIFKILLDGSAGFSVPVFSKFANISDFPNFEIHKHNIVKDIPRNFLDFVRYPGVYKDK